MNSETKTKIIEIIQTIFDPEIPVDIYNLGLIYDIECDDSNIKIKMTLTSPGCPSAQELPVQVHDEIKNAFPDKTVKVDLVWDPPWDMSRMSEEAQLTLDMFGMNIPSYDFYEFDDFDDFENDQTGDNK